MLKTITTYTAPIALMIALSAPAMAQNQPGAHFFEMWDLNEDGIVTLEEARERRDDIFNMFDEVEDGILTAEEYVLFDETRQADMELNGIGQQAGKGQGAGKGGNGQGKGMGQGQGGGQGKNQGAGQGQGQGMGEHGAAVSMERQNADLNGDGQVTREEFQQALDPWFTRQDRNGDGVLTTEDFGRK